MIELDVVSIDIFDLPPLTEYKLYIRNFGNSNAVQTYCQTNDDDQSVETQTYDIDTANKAVQFPVDVGSSMGLEDGENFTMDTQDTKKLTSFLQSFSGTEQNSLQVLTLDTGV